MKRFGLLLLGVWLMIAITGCKPSTTATAPATENASTNFTIPGLPTKAQPKLQTLKLYIGSQEMSAELALTPIQEETGMMFRTNMGPNEGMLFVFGAPQQVSFWMMNTILPLSAAYIAPDGTIMEIHDFKPFDTNSVVAATANIQYVLETPKDWFKTNHLEVGTVISSERGPLQKVFFGR